MCTFQSRIAKALLLGKKEKQTPKRGHLSTIANDEAICKKKNIIANPIPVDAVCYDSFPCLQANKSVTDIALVVIRTFPVQNAKLNSVWLKTETTFAISL